jgi:hypothetical protein
LLGEGGWSERWAGEGLRGDDRQRERKPLTSRHDLVDGGWVHREPGRPKSLRQ